MATFKSSSSLWRVGTSEFKDLGGGYLAIKMECWTPEGTTVEKFKFSEKLLPKVPEKLSPNDEYYVALKLNDIGDVETFESIRPNRYSDELVFPVDMTRERLQGEDVGEPTFYGPDSYGRHKINVFLEMQREDFKGVRIKYNLLHKFCNDGNGNLGFDFTLETLQDKKAVRIQEFFNFWTALTQAFPVEPVMEGGAIVNYRIVEPMAWPDDGNPYPELLARLLDKKPRLRISGRAHQVLDLYRDKNQAAPDNSPVPSEEKPVVEEEDDPLKDW